MTDIGKRIETYVRLGELFRNVGVDLRPIPLPEHVEVWLAERRATELLKEEHPAEVIVEMARDAVYYRVHLEDPEDEPSAGSFGLLLHPDIAFDLMGTGLTCGELVGLPPAEDPTSMVYAIDGHAHFANAWQFLASHRIARALAASRQGSLPL
jgi:hypothetical protein